MVYAGQLADSGKQEEGIQQIKSLLKGNAEDREVYVNLATVYNRLKRWQDADAALDKADQVSTKQEEKEQVAFLRAAALERQKKFEQAEDLFRKILVTNPNNPAVLNYLGYMFADHGQKLDEALGIAREHETAAGRQHTGHHGRSRGHVPLDLAGRHIDGLEGARSYRGHAPAYPHSRLSGS